jgi:cobalt-zinc-cadmium efflux system outer membrane protein
MRIVPFVSAVVCCALGVQASAAAQGVVSLEDALARARARAPDVLAARARVEESRARLIGASVRFRDNPLIDVDAGPRLRPDSSRSWDVAVSAGQTFETGGQRGARIAAARADIDHAAASADEATRVVLRDVALAYVTALGQQERVRLLRDNEQFTSDLRNAAERRYTVGDIAALDRNLATIASARARADRIRAESDLASSLQPLRFALGLASDAPLSVTGTLAREPASLAVLQRASAQSPVLKAADAEIARSAADARLAAAARRPDLGVRLTAKREDDDHAVLGGLTITWPAFNRGQELLATADAARARVTAEREAASRLIQLDIAVGLESYRQRADAAGLLHDVALAAVMDNEDLARRSFDAGEMSLLDLLLVRQDATATRLAYIEALTDAALASIAVDARAGVLQ